MAEGTRADALRRRNALWKALRELPPGPEFAAVLNDLSDLTGWPHDRILAGLGLPPAQVPPPRHQD